MSDLISKYDVIKAMFSDPPELHYPDWYMSIIEGLQTPWIPISKTPPKMGAWVLVTRKWGGHYFVVRDMKLKYSWIQDTYEAQILDTMDGSKVVAWMSLPEPYEGCDDE